MEIRPMTPADWPRVQAIYQEGIETGHATFETHAPDWEGWDAEHVTTCRLVAQEQLGELRKMLTSPKKSMSCLG